MTLRPSTPSVPCTSTLRCWQSFRRGKKQASLPVPLTGFLLPPVKLGRLPFSYTGVLHVFQKAAKDAGIGAIGTHAMRHTYRSWLDAVKTPLAVQQKLMRHADIRTTMNTYGNVVTDEMVQAGSKVARLALNGT